MHEDIIDLDPRMVEESDRRFRRESTGQHRAWERAAEWEAAFEQDCQEDIEIGLLAVI